MSTLINNNKYLGIISRLRHNFNNNKPINILFCDLQDKYMPKLFQYQDVIHTAENIAAASKILNLNQIVSEQKKNVFGVTIPEIKKHLTDRAYEYEKTKFSMLDKELIQKYDQDSVYVLLGIEAHVCVTQTAITLLENNKDLIVLSDGITSVNPGDRNVALKNLMEMGAYVTTSQSFLFLLLQDANHSKFKSLLPILANFSNRRSVLLNKTKF